MTQKLKQMAALTSLNEMFEKGWFSICTVDTVSDLLGVNPKCESYTILKSLHCINFNKMPVELRDAVPSLIKDCLGMEPVFKFTMEDMQSKKMIAVEEAEDVKATEKKGVFARIGWNK